MMKDVVAPFNNVLLGLRVAQWVLYSRSRSSKRQRYHGTGVKKKILEPRSRF